MSTTPAYIVFHQHEAIPMTQTLFTHDRLLTARKAAMSHVEKLLAELWQRGDYQTIIEVRLIETGTEPIPFDSPAIALVYQLTYSRKHNLTYPEAKAAFCAAMDQLHAEFLYYQANAYSMGFGYFRTEMELGENPRQTFCHLYEASGYTNVLSSQCEAYHTDTELPGMTLISYYEDQHDRAGLLVDELVG
ncbi:hypothetical protein GO755_36020 [Spirosoma sp. HMF4905]|uniref:Uncharacterized protein n=1 Tax=Spirosoma arboris TaxID=2682092 RepID=A0A7K1SNV1_9BACT|nr:hypothetical protein [Spirosoma arboris]MVM35485.1 hypothetical protein [Spirosoma arboris]